MRDIERACDVCGDRVPDGKMLMVTLDSAEIENGYIRYTTSKLRMWGLCPKCAEKILKDLRLNR